MVGYSPIPESQDSSRAYFDLSFSFSTHVDTHAVGCSPWKDFGGLVVMFMFTLVGLYKGGGGLSITLLKQGYWDCPSITEMQKYKIT